MTSSSTPHMSTVTDTSKLLDKNDVTKSQFLWRDVHAYQERLRSFHHNPVTSTNPDMNGSIVPSTIVCLPIEISPIICARFGWKRYYPQQSQEQNDSSDSNNDSTDSSSIILSCQNQKCNGVICIKIHPLLSLESKMKLTFVYREMLATSHSGDCPFKFDALSWLKHDEKESNGEDHGDNNTLKVSSSSSSSFVVPPYLMFLSTDYEFLENYNQLESRGALFITEYIKSQCQRLAKYYTFNTSESDEFIDSILDGQHKKQMLDIFVDESLPPTSTSQTILSDALLKIVKEWNTCNTNFNHESKIEENRKQEQISNALKRLRNELYDLTVPLNDNNNDEDTTNATFTIEALLLSIFGWRIHHDVDEPTSSRETKQTKIFRCNLCLNCSPISQNDASSCRPTKKMRLEEKEDVEDTSNQSENTSHYKFHLINSHRYYCPFVCGFHSANNNNKDETNIDSQRNIDVIGTSTPCWILVWKCIIQSLQSKMKSPPKQSSVEEWFYAIRDKIHSSIVKN